MGARNEHACLCRDRYDITVVSPRNYFLFTALLPAVATGNLEERSVTEPIRRILAGKVHLPLPPSAHSILQFKRTTCVLVKRMLKPLRNHMVQRPCLAEGTLERKGL